jgi:hypothetical protein
MKSADRADGTPIPWGALSGLAADPVIPDRVFAIDDSFYRSNRIFGIDLAQSPALLDTELPVRDSLGVLRRCRSRILRQQTGHKLSILLILQR